MKRRNDRAFTLIEVLVALAILAIVLVALLRMEINSVSLSARTSISFRALLLAVRETDELELRNFNGEYEKEIDEFTVKARTELTSQKGIPFEKMSLQVLYGSSDYADINTFKLKL